MFATVIGTVTNTHFPVVYYAPNFGSFGGMRLLYRNRTFRGLRPHSEDLLQLLLLLLLVMNWIDFYLWPFGI